MPTLEVSGATLYYETFGNGPLLLLIPGAQGTGIVFHDIARLLSDHFTVACWDRRGFSKSILKGRQNFADRLDVDADDAQLLIAHLSSEKPAIVLGSSSGAIVAQTLLLRHPSSVDIILSHEPPCFAVLPDEYSAQAKTMTQRVYDTYRAEGPNAAMEVFTGALAHPDEASLMRSNMGVTHGDEVRANTLFWFEFELRQYASSALDLQGLVNEKTKFIPVAGVDSGDGPTVGPIKMIAHAMGKDVQRLPGAHVGYVTQPDEFANSLRSVIRRHQGQN